MFTEYFVTINYYKFWHSSDSIQSNHKVEAVREVPVVLCRDAYCNFPLGLSTCDLEQFLHLAILASRVLRTVTEHLLAFIFIVHEVF